MKKWVMIPLVIFVSIITGAGYYYYNYIYQAPAAVEGRELMETNSAYEYLIEDAKTRVAENDYICKVLINPVCGGSDKGISAGELTESDAVLGIARYVDTLNTDDRIGIFLTRDTDTAPTIDQRKAFIDVVDPDIIIELRLDSSNDTTAIGTSIYYDDKYYDPHLVNSQLADIMEKSIVTEIGGVAAGLFPLEADTSELLAGYHIPALVIKCGYATNDKEAPALLSESYRSNIALGILNGIRQAKGIEDVMEEESTEPETEETETEEMEVYG